MIGNINIWEDNKEKINLKTIKNLDKIVMVEELYRYNNHIPEKTCQTILRERLFNKNK